MTQTQAIILAAAVLGKASHHLQRCPYLSDSLAKRCDDAIAELLLSVEKKEERDT